MPGAGPGDRIRSRCWPSFCDNVVMGRDSWQLCFLSARIFCDINNKCHSGAVSIAAQQTHDRILMCTLILLHPPPPFLFTYPNLSWFCPLYTLYHCLCSHLYVLLCILIFSSHTNVFALIFICIFRRLCTLNEAYQWSTDTDVNSDCIFRGLGGYFPTRPVTFPLFGITMTHLCKYTDPYASKKEIYKALFFFIILCSCDELPKLWLKGEYILVGSCSHVIILNTNRSHDSLTVKCSSCRCIKAH